MFLDIIFMLFSFPNILPWTSAQPGNKHRKAAWLPGSKYLQVYELALIGQPLGLGTSDNNTNNNNNNNSQRV